MAFSALTAPDAERVSKGFSLVERTNLREKLAAVRDAPDTERRDALKALVEAVKAPVSFPHPASHDEGSCVFRALEQFFPEHIATELARLGSLDRALVAVALCHFTEEYRQEVWNALPTGTRAATRSMLPQVPSITQSRTKRYAQELAKRAGLTTRITQ